MQASFCSFRRRRRDASSGPEHGGTSGTQTRWRRRSRHSAEEPASKGASFSAVPSGGGGRVRNASAPSRSTKDRIAARSAFVMTNCSDCTVRIFYMPRRTPKRRERRATALRFLCGPALLEQHPWLVYYIGRCTLAALLLTSFSAPAQRQCLCGRTRAQLGSFFFNLRVVSFALAFVLVPGTFRTPIVARATAGSETKQKRRAWQPKHTRIAGRTDASFTRIRRPAWLALSQLEGAHLYVCTFAPRTHLLLLLFGHSVYVCLAGDNRNNKRAAEKEERESKHAAAADEQGAVMVMRLPRIHACPRSQ